MGKPVAVIVAQGFENDALFNARREGVDGLCLAPLQIGTVPLPNEIAALGLGEQIADSVIVALTSFAGTDSAASRPSPAAKTFLTFRGATHEEAAEKMEKHLISRRWSDGLPVIPPTRDAVDRMLEGTDLERRAVVGRVEPSGAEATVEIVAVNAVMAGCLPMYMPLLVASVQAITDVRFNLHGVQSTAGMVSPLLIVSGPALIDQLNINDGFGTIGPGWRANVTVGRALRLIMINVGHGWPGLTDMKTFGSPFKHIPLMAENERAYGGFWEPIRVAEGFRQDQATVSVMPAVSWQVDHIPADRINVANLVESLANQGKVKYDRFPGNWGMDNLALLSPGAFDAVRREQKSRADIQDSIFQLTRVPAWQFFEGKAPHAGTGRVKIPEDIVEAARKDRQTLVPLIRQPESIKVLAAGAPGPAMCAYIGTWGFGASYFVTREVSLPPNWARLVKKNKGWATPVIR